MNKWDTRFMRLANEVASWSKDPSTQVGAVLVSPDRRVILPGYNGFPAALSDDRTLLADRETRIGLSLHAEHNAVLFAARDLAGYTIYVSQQPCVACLRMLVQARVARVVCPEAPPEFAARWGMEGAAYRVLEQHIDMVFVDDGT